MARAAECSLHIGESVGLGLSLRQEETTGESTSLEILLLQERSQPLTVDPDTVRMVRVRNS